MPTQKRGRPNWRMVGGIMVGMSLVGWSVQDVLTWWQQTALVFGVLFLAFGVVASSRPGRDTDR